MSKFDDLLTEAIDAGVDPDWVDRLRAASDGSPLRAEKKQLETQLQEATENANRYRSATLRSQFTALGIKVKPDALNVPTDLDPLDADAVRSWAESMELVEPPPPAVTPDQQQQHEQIATAAAGAQPAPTSPRDAARAEVLAAETADEFWAKAEAAGAVQ